MRAHYCNRTLFINRYKTSILKLNDCRENDTGNIENIATGNRLSTGSVLQTCDTCSGLITKVIYFVLIVDGLGNFSSYNIIIEKTNCKKK